MLDLIDLLIAALFGAATCFCFCMAAHNRHKKAWQLEYRRLMGGIKSMYQGIEMHEGKESCNSDTYSWSPLCAAYRLRQLYNGDR